MLQVLQAVRSGDDVGALALLEDASVGGALRPVNLSATLLQAVVVRPWQPPTLRTAEHLLVQRGVRLADNTACLIAIRTTFEAAFGAALKELPSPELVLGAQQAGVAPSAALRRRRCGGRCAGGNQGAASGAGGGG